MQNWWILEYENGHTFKQFAVFYCKIVYHFEMNTHIPTLSLAVKLHLSFDKNVKESFDAISKPRSNVFVKMTLFQDAFNSN